jgi:hypothetical protein
MGLNGPPPKDSKRPAPPAASHRPPPAKRIVREQVECKTKDADDDGFGTFVAGAVIGGLLF